MFQLNYNNRHTFLISGGVVLIVFGLLYFYQHALYEFNRILIFHSLSLIIGSILLYKGMTLWEYREDEEEKIGKLNKKNLIASIEEKNINNKIGDNQIKLKELTKQNIELKKKNKKKRKNTKIIEAEIKRKKAKAKKIIKDIDNLIEDKEKIYNERKKDINKIPDNFASGATPFTSTPFPAGSRSIAEDIIRSQVMAASGLDEYILCNKCHTLFKKNPEKENNGMCPSCDSMFDY